MVGRWWSGEGVEVQRAFIVRAAELAHLCQHFPCASEPFNNAPDRTGVPRAATDALAPVPEPFTPIDQ
jgi:hypothetical protein